VKAVAPDIHHRFGGSHAIGGERHDKKPCTTGLTASATSCQFSISQDQQHLG
jgi:hypothetical protein